MIAIPETNTITDELDTVRGGQESGSAATVPAKRNEVACIGTGVFHACVVLPNRQKTPEPSTR
jgi:hypothetical protein